MNSAQTLNLAMKQHQAGNLRDAEQLYRQLLLADSHHADAWHLLGVIAHQVGRHELAIENIRKALQVRPNFAESHCILGAAQQALGKLEEAVTCFRRAVFLKPDLAEAHINLGRALRDQGKLAEAAASFKQALRLKPSLADGHHNLGLVLQMQGKLAEAVASYERTLSFKPDNAKALNNLGIAQREQGKLEEAAASLQKALRIKPDFVEALNNLGEVLKMQGRLAEAAANCERALFLKPDFAEAHNNLGTVRQEQGKLTEAAASYEQALRIKPDFAEVHDNLGNLLYKQGKLEEARGCFERALQINPDLPSGLCNLGLVLQQLNDLAGSEKAFRAALRNHPRHVDTLWVLANQLRGKLPAADRALLEARLTDPNLSDPDRAKLLFGLAQVCDAKREYKQAAQQLRRANALTLDLRRRNGQAYDLAANARFIENLMAGFTPAFFERVRGYGLETERPVFVFGLPRSGTTLTEQILAAHSQVCGAGELTLGSEDFLAMGSQPTDASSFAALPGLQRETVRLLAQRHVDQLGNLDRTAQRVVDKLPDNYLYLGLLATLFPRAKFIHCRRDLRDVAVSCWMTHFQQILWANDLQCIAARFREYRRLMQHWQAVLPVPVLEVQYEQTVADLPGTARRLVEWCGLEWEPGCLAFHESKQPIHTASVTQVREPIHSRSVARWRNYERDLGALFDALEPEPKEKSSLNTFGNMRGAASPELQRMSEPRA